MKLITTFSLFVILTLFTYSSAIARQTNEVKCEKITGSRVETENYYVNICGIGNKEDPWTFVLSSKSGKITIFPFTKISLSNPDLIFRHKNFTYILKHKAPSNSLGAAYSESDIPYRLIIKKYGKIVVSEAVIKDGGGYFYLP